MSVLSCLATSYVGAVTWEILGLRGLFGLWIFTVPYMYPGLYSPTMGFKTLGLLFLLAAAISLFTMVFRVATGLRVMSLNLF